jgi:WD40 repeat protein
MSKTPYEYRVGGSLPEHSPCYATRQADRDFYEGLKAGYFCYVFNSRQMGKTSLLVRTLYRLQNDGVICTTIDVSGRGSGNIQEEQWYAGIAYTLIKDFKLGNPLQFMKGWWKERDFLAPPQRLEEVIELILLPNTSAPITIFIDEIDSTLSLDFSTDDFFVLIRSCYDKRSTNPAYQRLTFALIGVATPSHLIADHRRTPFNIGKAIELTGFTLAEAEPLVIGLQAHAEDPHAVLTEILNWTGGQPFLTQKLCYLLVNKDKFIRSGEETIEIERLVRLGAIENWESKDNPPHFKTISTRLTINENRSSSLLGLYQQILTNGSLAIEDRSEERELQLSGVVVKSGNELRIANLIYTAIFDRSWVDKQLANLRPYGANFKEWIESNQKDKSRLLRGKALEDALNWSKGKELNTLDSKFLSASREQHTYEKNQAVLQTRVKQLRLVSGVAIACAIYALYSGSTAQIATIKAQNSLNRELIRSETTKNSLETLIATLKAAQLFRNQLLWFNQSEQEIRDNLQYGYDTLERNILNHTGSVTGVQYSPDDGYVASVSSDGHLRIWKPDGELIKSIDHHQPLQDLAISNDSQKIVTVGDDPQVRIWNSQGKELLPKLERNKDNKKLMRVAITPDSNYIAAATYTDDKKKDSSEVIIWDIKSRRIIQVLHFPYINHTNSKPSTTKYAFRDLKFSADGKSLAAASTDRTIKIWRQWRTKPISQMLIGHLDWVYSLSFSKDGKWLTSSGGGSDKKMIVWQINGNKFKPIKTIEGAHNDAFYVAFNPKKHQLTTVGSSDNLIKIWDFDQIVNANTDIINVNTHSLILGTNTLLNTFHGNKSVYKGISYSPNGERIAVPDINSQVTIWEPDLSQFKNIVASKLSIHKVIYSHDGQYIATAGADNKVRIWKFDGSLYQTISGHQDWIFGLSFSPDDKFIASASEDNTVEISRVSDGSLIRSLKHDSFALDVSFSQDPRYLASVGNDEKLKIWDAKNGKLLKEFESKNNDQWQYKVVFSPPVSPNIKKSKYLAINTKDGIIIYETSNFTKVHTLQNKDKYSNNLLRITFSPNSKIIASSGVDKMVRLWNIEDGKLLASYKAHQDASHDIQFSSNSKEFATTSRGVGQIKFWSLDGKLLRTIEGFKGQSLAYSPNGKTFVAVDGNGIMKFWNLDKLKREDLTLDQSYKNGCDRLREYLAHRQPNPNSQEEAEISSICQH